jgi:hypothetical protein
MSCFRAESILDASANLNGHLKGSPGRLSTIGSYLNFATGLHDVSMFDLYLLVRAVKRAAQVYIVSLIVEGCAGQRGLMSLICV